MSVLSTFVDAVKRGYQEEAARVSRLRSPRKDRSGVLLLDADDVADVVAAPPPVSLTKIQARGYQDVNHPVLWHEFRGRTLCELADHLIVREQVQTHLCDAARQGISDIVDRRSDGRRGHPPRRLVKRYERLGATLDRLRQLRAAVDAAISPHTYQA